MNPSAIESLFGPQSLVWALLIGALLLFFAFCLALAYVLPSCESQDDPVSPLP